VWLPIILGSQRLPSANSWPTESINKINNQPCNSSPLYKSDPCVSTIQVLALALYSWSPLHPTPITTNQWPLVIVLSLLRGDPRWALCVHIPRIWDATHFSAVLGNSWGSFEASPTVAANTDKTPGCADWSMSTSREIRACLFEFRSLSIRSWCNCGCFGWEFNLYVIQPCSNFEFRLDQQGIPSRSTSITVKLLILKSFLNTTTKEIRFVGQNLQHPRQEGWKVEIGDLAECHLGETRRCSTKFTVHDVPSLEQLHSQSLHPLFIRSNKTQTTHPSSGVIVETLTEVEVVDWLRRVKVRRHVKFPQHLSGLLAETDQYLNEEQV
jgi:hypothetical protein